MLITGLKDARRCAWMGELDSEEDEESDEISDEFEFTQTITDTTNMNASRTSMYDMYDIPSNDTRLDEEGQKTMIDFMDTFRELNDQSRQLLIKRLLQSISEDPTSEEKLKDFEQITKFMAFQVTVVKYDFTYFFI